MKKLLFILFTISTLLCTAQTDSLELYKKGYQISKALNEEYKIKISDLNNVVIEQDSLVIDLRSVISTQKYIINNDSLQLDILDQQTKLLKDNINIYQKELDRQNKFWRSPIGGIVIGIVGTVAIIHVIDYSLPR